MAESNDLLDKLDKMRGAYLQLHTGAGKLLDIGALFWTERLLLKIVYALYGRRLEQIGGVLPDDR